MVLLNTDMYHPFNVAPGDRIAQLVIQPVASVDFMEAALVSELAQSERGDGGFGSTGVNKVYGSADHLTEAEKAAGLDGK